MGVCYSAPLPSCNGPRTREQHGKRGKGFRLGGKIVKPAASEPSRVCPSFSPESANAIDSSTADYLLIAPPKLSAQRHSGDHEKVLPGSGPFSVDGSGELEAQDFTPAESQAGDSGSYGKLKESITVFGKGVATLKGAKGLGSLAAEELGERSYLLDKHNVQIRGAGPELLVFSHTFGTTQEIWNVLLDSFDLAKYRIVLYDLAGSDSTDLDSFDFQRYSTLHGYADDLLELLSELGVEPDWGEPCTFIGHGVSGMIGLIAAVERPQSFKRLILVGASPKYLNTANYRGGFDLNQLDGAFASAQENYKMWMSGLPPRVSAQEIEPRRVREFLEPLFCMRPDITFCLMKTLFTCDLRDTLRKVGVQCHLLHLSHDPAVKWSTVEHMLNQIPNAYAEMLPVDEAARCVHPEVLAEAILRHLSIPIRSSLSRQPSRQHSLQKFPSFRSCPDSVEFLTLKESKIGGA